MALPVEGAAFMTTVIAIIAVLVALWIALRLVVGGLIRC
jgi:hypothetical protein